MEDKQLPLHEWLLIGLLITFFLVLTVTTCQRRQELPALTEPPHHLVPPDVQVKIEGAVAHPGFYTVPKESTVQQVLEKASLLPEADTNRLKLHQRVRDGQKIKVPRQATIIVYIEGAVENPRAIEMPKGAIVQDLIEKIAYLPEADQTKLQKTRRLKNGEVFYIPTKKPKKTNKSVKNKARPQIATKEDLQKKI